MKNQWALAAIIVSASFLSAQDLEAKHGQQKPHPSKPAATPSDTDPGARIVHYGAKDVVKLNTKLRFTTLIVLPEKEQILDFICGDKEFWIVNGNQNFAYIKPAKEGTTTNLDLITASGNIYSFVLLEISQVPGLQPDLKVFVQPKEESMVTAAQRAPRFVPAQELDSCREQLRVQKEQTQHTIDSELAKEIGSLHFTYQFQPEKKPFHVSAIYNDRKFTYIVAKPDETPTLYELRDGKPNLVNFEYKDGIFVAEKVIERGYLAIGKDRLFFFKKGE